MANIKISELNPLLTVQDADVIPIVDNAITKKVTAEILRGYTQGNSVLLTGAQTIAGIKTFTSQLASSVATGTAPFSVASTTKVTNLNADLLDGLSSADFQATLSGTGIVKSTAGTISYLTDNSTNWNTAFNDKINSAAVTGSGTNTLTLTQQDAGTITATWVNGTLIREIRNNTGATLTKGTIVYISGATGNKPTVSKAIATGDSTSAQTFGFVQENIANNAEGFVVVIGDLTGVDTSAFTEGDQLYLSSTTAGAFTATKQYAPNHLVYVGIVTRSHPTLGQIEVNIQNGYELDELHNVAAQNPSNGDILQYVTSTGLWTKIAGTTSAISEGSNLYFTNARSRSAISLTTTGTSGAATYNSTTGVLNVPNYADTDTGITSLNGLTALTQTFAVGTSGTDFGISSATSTHTFNLPTASATNRGALSSADWTTFNNKQNALTNPITGTGTLNFLPKFTAGSTLGNSIVSEGAGGISINGTLPNTNTTIHSTKSATNYIDLQSTIINQTVGLITRSASKSYFTGLNYSAVNIWEVYDLTANASRFTIASTGEATFALDATINGVKVGRGAGSIATNTALGSGTLNANTTGATNTAVGVNALTANTTGSQNTSVGVSSLSANNTGSQNTAIGRAAVFTNTTGSNNTGLGYQALYFNSVGSNNTALGAAALLNNTASNNTAVGFEAATTNTSGTGITAIGYQALKASTGDRNTAVGGLALVANTTAVNNTAIGYQSLTSNTIGAGNTAVGYTALFTNINGSANTAVGVGALAFTTSANSTALGYESLKNNTGANNTAVGFEAATANTTGTLITAIGYQALKANTTGMNNTALGNSALIINTTGNQNTAIGVNALNSNTTGGLNTAIGLSSLSGNSTGGSNTGIGWNCSSGNFSGSVILGRDAAATANNQFVVGSTGTNAGAVATEALVSDRSWAVIINGVAYKILMKA